MKFKICMSLGRNVTCEGKGAIWVNRNHLKKKWLQYMLCFNCNLEEKIGDFLQNDNKNITYNTVIFTLHDFC